MCHADSKAVVSGETVSNAELIDFCLKNLILENKLKFHLEPLCTAALVNAVSANYNSD